MKPMKSYFLRRNPSHTSEFSAWVFVCIPHLLPSDSSFRALANRSHQGGGDEVSWCPGNHRQHHCTARFLACIWSFLVFSFLIKDLYLGRPVPKQLQQRAIALRNRSPYSQPLGKIQSLVHLGQCKCKLLNWWYKVAQSLTFCLALWISFCLTTYALVWRLIPSGEIALLKPLHTLGIQLLSDNLSSKRGFFFFFYIILLNFVLILTSI